LVERLWEQTRQALLSDPEVVKVYRPAGARIWLKIPYDPEQARAEETKKLEEKEFDPSSLRPKRLHPVGPVD
jgi:hypothetical protein